MSDAVVIAFIVGFFSTATTLLTIVLNSIAARKAAKQSIELSAKVDAYHKEVNGNMGKLIETTKDLATAKEKARDKTNDQ